MNAKAWFFFFRPEILVLAKFGPKIKILTLSWNLTHMLIWVCRSQGDVHFFIFDQKYPLLVNLVQKNKVNSLSINLLDYCNLSMQDLVVMFSFSVFIQKYLVRKIWRIHWYCSLLFHFDWTYLFWANFVKKVKIVKLGRSLIPRLIWICRIKWWCSSFSVLDRKCFF